MDASEHIRTEPPARAWDELNREWLIAAIARLRERIEAGNGRAEHPTDCIVATAANGFLPALTGLAAAFGLSPFERELLLLMAGLELDQRLRETFARFTGDAAARATFGSALALLVSPHWDALSPQAPLRHWHMVAPELASVLMLAPLRLDERVLHFVAGIPASDVILAGLVTHHGDGHTEPGNLPLARRIATAIAKRAIIVLDGGADAERRDQVLAAVTTYGMGTLWIDAGDLPGDPEMITVLARHLDREVVLGKAVPILNVTDASARSAKALASRMTAGTIWLGENAPELDALAGGRVVLRFELPATGATSTRAALLARCCDTCGRDAATEAELERAAQHFRLGRSAIDSVVEAVGAAEPSARADAVWPAARAAARGGLDGLAQRILTRASFDDIVLPSGQTAMLRNIARQLRHRERVYRDWRFGEKYQLGQGLVALFAGESGTGKTLAAEAIANEAGLDLYRVDLATLVSKYIGETEKNLKRLFDVADSSGAVLLFDEADALFGKRSEVKDSHDRYANIEVAYLLQRVEAYRGLAVLTTNMKSALDRAFLRRIRFVVNFPVPYAAAREQIWRRQFPPAAPLGKIDFKALARLNICGGNIRSIAVSAAFKAADAGRAIDQALLMAAAHEEFAKLERSMGGDRGRTA
ncbi:MAG: ATP-binding protein [Phyllobacterium sp.]|uniref:ATP-binding protein n=1 Tax=Phyllobacterium sp. TaxID=1871046 RepID=UPI0030F29D45